MHAAQALADLTEISSQIEGAVIAETGGKIVASTFADERGERVAEAALDLLRAADDAQRESDRAKLAQVEAATPAGSVFLVRDDRHVIAAVTNPQPTTGLVFYDLKTCLRLLGEEEAEEKKPKRRSTKKKADA